MKYIFKIIMVAVAMVIAIPSFAVTDKEMEQARTIAAKHYLRYANNGSDYLDKINPATMSELNNALKAKEKENIKSFNAVAVPKDYASWDKNKLVEYWSSTFFKSAGLKEDGKKCLSVLAKNLKKINVNAAAPANNAEKSDATAETSAAPASQGTPASAQPSASKENAPSVDGQQPDVDEATLTKAEEDVDLVEEQPRKSSNTGWYIGILVVLIGVVIWLVVYASKSMKETGVTLSDHKAGEKEIRETKRAAKEELNKMRDQYASSLTSKNDEIKQLKSQCEALESELEAARHENGAIRRELESVRRELSSANSYRQETPVREKTAPRPSQETQRQASSQQQASASYAPPAEKSHQANSKQGGLPPLVYLGSVNQKGLFTKASRSLNSEYSVFQMDIPDGHHGVYRVVNDAKVLDRVLADPDHWLGGGCVMVNPEDADIATEIVTLNSGEAFFSDNTCRVTKKARIKFI